MQDITITPANAFKAWSKADKEGKSILENLLGKDTFLNQKITDRVKSFQDVLDMSGRTIDSLVIPGDTPDEIAYKKAKLVAEVYNEGTVLDPMDTSQYKYYPWHEIKPGFGLSFCGCDLWHSDSGVGVRLCFKSAELAEDAGRKFIDIYTDLKIK